MREFFFSTAYNNDGRRELLNHYFHSWLIEHSAHATLSVYTIDQAYTYLLIVLILNYLSISIFYTHCTAHRQIRYKTNNYLRTRYNTRYYIRYRLIGIMV